MLENLNQYLTEAPLLAIMASYIGGLLTSFTPCVFPIIPITIGVLGVKQTESKLHAFFLALVYVLGMALVYSVLGMLAGVTGTFFGSVSIHPVTNLIVGNVCLLFSLSMFDAIQIPLPQFLVTRKVSTPEKKGFLRAFVMGTVSGTVVAPCTAPVLGTLLTFIGSTQNYVYGGVLMFVYAFGLGTLLIIIGVFSGMLATLQKSSNVMIIVKRILGFLMLIVAEYFFIRAGQFWF
jgi:thiol:disulfide interchange protein DsbD